MAKGWRFPSFLRYYREDFANAFRDPNMRIIFAILMGVISIATILLTLNLSGTTYEYILGDIALEDIRVPRDIHYRNEEQSSILEKQAAATVPPVFIRDGSMVKEKLRLTAVLFNACDETVEHLPVQNPEDVSAQLALLKTRYLPRYLHFNDRILTQILGSGDLYLLRMTTIQVMMYIYDSHQMGIVDKPLTEEQKTAGTVSIKTINSVDNVAEYSRPVDTLVTVEQMNQQVYGLCRSFAARLPKDSTSAIASIIGGTLQANITFSPEETAARIQEKIKTVRPVMEVLKKGQTIIREGDTITPDVLKKIEILNRQSHRSSISYVVGVLGVQILFVMIFGYFILRNSRQLVPDRQSSYILGGLTVLYMLIAFLVGTNDSVADSRLELALLLPIPFMTMLVAILYNTWLAMLVGLNVIFFTTFLTGGDFTTCILSFSSSIMGLLIVGRVDRRSDFLRGGFIMGVMNALLVMSFALMNQLPFKYFQVNMQLSLFHGLINSIMVMGFIPLFENLFDITTKFKLLELSDLNADIFKRMLLEAPGTYNHSLLVSTMAEAACKEIHADHLLARVGAFYHDIGKIDDSGMYIENRITDPRARELSPTEYCQLIISHVRKGVEMARRHHLPDDIIDFVREHHGKSTMTFFYHQALEEADREDRIDEVNKSDFQYPGPRPHSKETAVVMLADVIEAASRSIAEPTHDKLAGLVTKIMFNKLNEGELEMADLSMAELTVIRQSFIKILTGIFHTRIQYPEQGDLRKLESKARKND